MDHLCLFPACPCNESIEGEDGPLRVPVSPSVDVVLLRPTCHPCNSAYEAGVQYGLHRAIRILRDKAAEGVLWATTWEDAITAITTLPDPGLETAEDEGVAEDEGRLWVREFGKEFCVPTEIDGLVERGELFDESWHNDVCPSFGTTKEWEGRHLRFWVNHVDPKSRELPGRRFCVVEMVDDEHTRDLCDTDDLAEALRVIGENR